MVNTKLIIALVVLLGITGIGYTAYSSIYNRGQEAARIECQEKFDKYQKEVDAKVATLETNLSVITATSLHQQLALNTEIEEILKRVKKVPVTIVKNGKCYPSPTFVEGINQAIDRANAK
jgi:Tfp pilus assembly protein PilO